YTVMEEEDLPFPEETDGIDAENRRVDCNGALRLPDLADGSFQIKYDWYYPGTRGWQDIHGALEISCNIFFWSAGLGTYRHFPAGHPKETVIQDWAMNLGYGSRTGIDLATEA